jgi:hypothetical protein
MRDRTLDHRLRRDLMKRLVADAQMIAAHFGLEYRAIEPERSNVTSRYGICYDDGTIKIRLAHSVSGRPLKYSSLVSTLCHELAHLKHFDHGPQFRSFNLELLAWARRRGIYRPGRASPEVAASPTGLLDLRTAMRSGKLPTLRESLQELLASSRCATGSAGSHVREPGPPSVDPLRETARPEKSDGVPTRETRSPSQLELFGQVSG